MVRRCVVPECSSTDLTTLVHRFPRKHCRTWQTSLKLNSYSMTDLLEKYVVCAHHFRISDYRHRESKHLNTTAVPTLDVLPEAQKNLEIQTKCPELQTSIPNVKRSIVISSVNIDSNGETINSKLSLVPGKTQTYSNCVTLSSSLPLIKMTHSTDPHESDTSIENCFHSDGEIIEDEMEIEEMLLEQNISVDCPQSKDLLEVGECHNKTEYSMDDIDDTSADNVSFIEEVDLTCDNANALTNYVEVIETNEETDDEHEQQLDPNELLYANFSRKDLIDELIAARSRINELETKLDNIQKALPSMIQNLNNFNKVLIS